MRRMQLLATALPKRISSERQRAADEQRACLMTVRQTDSQTVSSIIDVTRNRSSSFHVALQETPPPPAAAAAAALLAIMGRSLQS